MEREFRLEGRCPTCNARHNAATEIAGYAPGLQEGSLLVCSACGEILEYDGQRIVVFPSEQWNEYEPVIKEVMLTLQAKTRKARSKFTDDQRNVAKKILEYAADRACKLEEVAGDLAQALSKGNVLDPQQLMEIGAFRCAFMLTTVDCILCPITTHLFRFLAVSGDPSREEFGDIGRQLFAFKGDVTEWLPCKMGVWTVGVQEIYSMEKA